IDQAVVCGEGRNNLTALIVPHWDNLQRALHAEAIDLDHKPVEELAGHPSVLALLRRRIDAALVNVSTWEQVKRVIVLPRPFTVAADELTVSLKLRRPVILAKYASQIEGLYRE